MNGLPWSACSSSLVRVLCRDLGPSPLLTFTGSGGKTTTSEELARGAAAAGQRVILTTTTKIRVPASHAAAWSLEGVKQALAAVEPGEPLFLGEASPDGKKLTGPGLDLLEEIRRSRIADLVVVEADGSRGASVKFYRDDEPVMPVHADRACILVGVDVVGAEAASPLVHRGDRLWPWLGLAPEAALSPSDVARAVFTQPGYLDRLGTRSTLMLNKIDTPALEEKAQALWRAFEPYLEESRLEAVYRRGTLIPGGVEVAWERKTSRVAAVLLAAGTSTRFGDLKQVALVEGVPMVRRALDTLREAGVDEVVLVLGHRADEVRRAAGLADLGELPVRVVVNPGYAEGMATSLHAGLLALDGACEGALVCLADMPHLQACSVRRVVDAARARARSIVAPSHAGRRGHPVFFARRWFPRLLEVQGDRGGAALLSEGAGEVFLVDVDDPGVLLDVDVQDGTWS